MTCSRRLFQLSCQFVEYSVVFVIAVFVMFSPTKRYIFLNFLLLDSRNMVVFLFCFGFVSFRSSPPRWPSGKASASRAKDPEFESRLRRDFFWVESYQ